MFHMFMFLQTRTVVDIAAESGQLIPSPHPLLQLYFYNVPLISNKLLFVLWNLTPSLENLNYLLDPPQQ